MQKDLHLYSLQQEANVLTCEVIQALHRSGENVSQKKGSEYVEYQDNYENWKETTTIGEESYARVAKYVPCFSLAEMGTCPAGHKGETKIERQNSLQEA